jgi:hypothetical protein
MVWLGDPQPHLLIFRACCGTDPVRANSGEGITGPTGFLFQPIAAIRSGEG